MKFRLRAFGLHLTGSACALALVLGSFYLIWYRWPGWYLSGVLSVVLVMCLVDVAVGPSLTLIVANPDKARRVLGRDIVVIVTLQMAALIYGTITLWIGRPLYYTYSNKSLDLVQASDLEADEIAQALKANPAFAPHWYSGVRWVWAPVPADPEAAAKIAGGPGFGDVVYKPLYFKPWADGLAELRKNLQPLSDVPGFSKAEKASLARRMVASGMSPAQPNAMVMWGEEGSRPLLTVFDPQSLEVRAMLTVRRRQ
ncbi:MAG TPA: hypothetical protein VGI91_11160 [Steroidobacteraceae bacterium]|jgi:hypothetical protein